MRAALLYDFGDYRIGHIPDPLITDTEALVEVTCVQASVTEGMLIAGEKIALHDSLRARLDGGEPIQFAGHEFAGVIRELGAAVTGHQIGDRVTAVETVNCGTCPYCTTRRGVVCARPQFIGFTRPGAFAELVAIPAANLVAIPDALTDSQAAAIQPLVGAIHAQAIAKLRPGETVLVTGSGVMGLLAIQLARFHGAGLVVATGRSREKLELAARLGADVVIDASRDDVTARVLELTDGIGVDAVIETAGGSAAAGLSGVETINTAVAAVRYGGRIVVVSVLVDGAILPLSRIREKGIALVHPTSGRESGAPTVDAFELAVNFVERGIVDIDVLITHSLMGIDSLPEAIEMTLNKRVHGAINPPQVHLNSLVTSCAPVK